MRAASTHPLEGPRRGSVPRAVPGWGRVEFAATGAGGAARLPGDWAPSGQMGLCVNTSRVLVRLAGFGGKAGRVVAPCVCVCAPPARALSELQMPTSQETIQKHEGSSDKGKGSLRSEPGPHS